MHPSYFEAKKCLQALSRKHPFIQDPKWTVHIGARWDAILEKDPSGQQCLNYVKELEEILTPMVR